MLDPTLHRLKTHKGLWDDVSQITLRKGEKFAVIQDGRMKWKKPRLLGLGRTLVTNFCLYSSRNS